MVGIELRQSRALVRDTDGFLLCDCGCNERFAEGDLACEVFKAELRDSGKNIVINSASGTTLLKVEHLLSTNGEGNFGLDKMKAAAVKLAEADHGALKKLYVFMHDALGCRI